MSNFFIIINIYKLFYFHNWEDIFKNSDEKIIDQNKF
jgi:hypothetical protein